MNHEPDFASRLVGTIQERELSPRPRWTFAARNALVVGLAAVTIAFGGLTVAASEYLLADRDWDLARDLAGRNTIAMMQSLPYLWLAALIILTLVTYRLLTKTRRGYRFAPATVLGGSVLASVALGSGLYATGWGPRTHEYARATVPAYDRLVVTRDRFWSNPGHGLLGGQVIHVTTTSEFALQDIHGIRWSVAVTGSGDGVAQGAYVRALGARTGTSTFAAETVLPWKRVIATSSVQ